MDESILYNATPLFLKGLERETNVQAGFLAEIPAKGCEAEAEVFVTAQNVYRLYVNGRLAAHGPARTAKGCFRVDRIPVKKYLKNGKNYFAFEVCSYGDTFHGYSNDTVLGPGFLLAAVRIGERIVLSAPSTFRGIRLTERAQYAERISHCRQMAEVYGLTERYFAWRTDPSLCDGEVAGFSPVGRLLARDVDFPSLKPTKTVNLVDFGLGELDPGIPAENAWFENNLAYYDNLAERPLRDFKQTKLLPLGDNMTVTRNGRGEVRTAGVTGTFYAAYDFGENLLGFPGLDFETEKPGTVDIVHLESCNFFDGAGELGAGANPVTRLHTPGGRFRFLAMEPALGRYYKLFFRDCGDVTIHRLSVTDFSHRETGGGSFQCSDDDLNRLYQAARQTLKLNSLDVFMDCPERERGGWLCDSFWTGRASRMLYGDTKMERAFLENFLLTDPDTLWNSFFPECYPSNKDNYRICPGITTWSFWLMEELCQFVKGSGNRDFAEKYRKRVARFVEGSLTQVGPSGLLENLPWLFIDWSLSNRSEYNQPISLGANCLYVRMLADLGELYGEKNWSEKAEKMGEILRNAIPADPPVMPDAFRFEDGKLIPKDVYSESCQYLTVWSELFDPQAKPNYIFHVVKTMGFRPEYPASTTVGRAGLFIGLQYRFDMLAKLGEYERLLAELRELYGFQLREGPGTLWETPEVENSSRCHGFTSYAGVQLMRDILGLGVPDELHKTVKIAPHPCGLRWARGTVQTSDGLISLSWVNRNGTPEVRVSLPKGWRAI